MSHFLSWTRDQPGTDVGPFAEYPYSDYWAYADYKYIAMLFQDQPSIYEVFSVLCTVHISMLVSYQASFIMLAFLKSTAIFIYSLKKANSLAQSVDGCQIDSGQAFK